MQEMDASRTGQAVLDAPPFDLADADFVYRVRELLQETGAEPSSILFEVTEGAALRDAWTAAMGDNV